MFRSAWAASILRWFAVLAGLSAVLGATAALTLPVALHVVDRSGQPIACGTGWHSDPTRAQREDLLNHQQHLLVGTQFVVSDYTGECAAKVTDRRRLAAGVAGVGSAVALSALLAPYAGRDRPRHRTDVSPDADALNSYATW